jgi:hypothetical protein
MASDVEVLREWLLIARGELAAARERPQIKKWERRIEALSAALSAMERAEALEADCAAMRRALGDLLGDARENLTADLPDWARGSIACDAKHIRDGLAALATDSGQRLLEEHTAKLAASEKAKINEAAHRADLERAVAAKDKRIAELEAAFPLMKEALEFVAQDLVLWLAWSESGRLKTSGPLRGENPVPAEWRALQAKVSAALDAARKVTT